MECTLSNVTIDFKEQDSISAAFKSSALPKITQSVIGASLSYEINPMKQWYVLRATYGRERKAYEYITAKGDFAYLPLRREKNKKGEFIRYIEKSLIPNILFVYASEKTILEYVRGINRLHYLNFYYNHLKKDKQGRDEKMTIPLEEMNNFIRLTSVQNDHVMLIDPLRCHFKSGDEVVVNEGEFKNVKGKVSRIAGQQRVVIIIEGLCCVATAYIPTSFLTKIK